MPGSQHRYPAQRTPASRRGPAMASARAQVLTPSLCFLSSLSGLCHFARREDSGRLEAEPQPRPAHLWRCVPKLLPAPPGTPSLLPLPPSPAAGATTQGGPGHFLDRSLVRASPSRLQADPWLLLPTRAVVQSRGSEGPPLPSPAPAAVRAGAPLAAGRGLPSALLTLPPGNGNLDPRASKPARDGVCWRRLPGPGSHRLCPF